MKRKVPPYGTYEKKSSSYMPNITVVCVIFGFHEGNLNVLLNRINGTEKWMVPGGFVEINEDIEATARRVLLLRTGLKDVYFRQFHLFGKGERLDIEDRKNILSKIEKDYLTKEEEEWYLSRFLNISYYALTEYSKVEITPGECEELKWFSLNNLPELFSDHEDIIKKGIETIKMQLGYIPIGYELLPDNFTMPELRSIYEAILGREIDRRNFQRKMLSTGLIKPLNKTRKSGAHKAPNLYSFIEKKYNEAEKLGLQLMSKNL